VSVVGSGTGTIPAVAGSVAVLSGGSGCRAMFAHPSWDCQIAVGIAPPFAARVVEILLAAQESLPPRLAPPLAHLAERDKAHRHAIEPSDGRHESSGRRERKRPFGAGQGGGRILSGNPEVACAGVSHRRPYHLQCT
jgi:hypothetical protein